MISLKNRRTEKILPEDVCVHRGFVLGNPWTHHEHGMGIKVATREEAIANYKEYFEEKVRTREPEFCDALNNLIIKNIKKESFALTCYCFPANCHAEIIRDWVERQKYCFNWFSNMAAITPFHYQGIRYETVENFYQACKAPKEDLTTRAWIANMLPHTAKKEGRKIDKCSTFEANKLKIMEYALRIKFNQPKWKEYLTEYKGEIVEKNNWSDKFWGIDIFTGEGENLLGKILMKIRGELI